ncbi:MAG: outer membrane protein transport protein [Sulfuritalea sp.]|jgi:long-chain fatty acid transport protein|nr:outer membrane protein transport protein [Sulfuritalea sp.]
MKLKKIAVLVAIAAASGSAFATNGYFSHGYGMKAKGMAGVGIAMPQDALAAATNPAGMVMVGDRLDMGVDWFKPNRGAEIVGNAFGFGPFNGSYDGNGDSSFLVPEFGYNKMMGWDMSVGVSVYGNGGMNTRYSTSPFAAGGFGLMGGQSPGGVNLEQLFIAPTFAMKLNKNHAVGVSIVMAYQTFGATGLEAFGAAGASSDATSLTNKGNDHSIGWGLRLGWTGQVSDSVTLGATYASKIKGKFNDYKGLFAEEGRFDIPENYGVGIAVKATPKLTIAADIQQINYSNSRAVANTVDCLFVGACQLGQTGGAGFGWGDMTVYKLGVSYDYSKDLTLRAGVSTNRQPVAVSQTFFNILAPGVVENHLTLGGTWTLANKNELTVGYMHAFKNTVNGSGSIGAGFGGGEANLHMSQDSLGVGYGMKF